MKTTLPVLIANYDLFVAVCQNQHVHIVKNTVNKEETDFYNVVVQFTDMSELFSLGQRYYAVKRTKELVEENNKK